MKAYQSRSGRIDLDETWNRYMIDRNLELSATFYLAMSPELEI